MEKFYRYQISELSPKTAFPMKNVEWKESDLEQLRENFYKEMNTLSEHAPEDYENFSICFDRISQKYMWCITAADYEGEDISLYDYMKVTEAILTCLEISGSDEKPYVLVAGDFSGIQKYIFSISSANNKGVAKRLRARSFYVDVVSKIFSQYVIDSFEVGRANILLQTGGKFYCMVPNVADAEETLKNIRTDFDRELFEKFHGMVSVNLAWLQCSDQDIENYSDTIVRLNDLLAAIKSKPFHELLKKDGKWNTEKFILYDELKDMHICENCGVELIRSSHQTCNTCNMQLELGKKLPHTKYIAYLKGDITQKGVYKIFKDYSIVLTQKIDRNNMRQAYVIEALATEKENSDVCDLPVINKYMVNHIPVVKEEYDRPMAFDEIAESSIGSKKLAVLKSDVDILGFLFAQGLRTKERHYGTISRINTMSRMLEIFNSGYIQTLLKSSGKYKNVYSVFSGGDDLFLIGPWNVMYDLALDIRSRFSEFVADNEYITMSSSIITFDNKTHISLMAEISEKELERAKNETIKEIYPDHTGRNAVCVMGCIMTWSDFKTQVENIMHLRKMVVENRVGSGILRRIEKYSKMYKQYLVDHDIWKLMFVPYSEYDRSRNYGKIRNDEYIGSLFNIRVESTNTINKNLFFAEFVVKTVMNLTKEEKR